MKTIPSLLHPFPITEGIHASKVFWKGGFPGMECDWNLPQNWSNGKVPGWKDLVVISAHFSKNNPFPIISEAVNDIAQLEIKSGAKLTITAFGQLTIDGIFCSSLGLINIGTMMNEGELNIQNTQRFCIHNLGMFINENALSMDKTIEDGIRESEDSSFVNCGEILELLVK
ncbi:MAG: hypothetical protein ACJAYJ_003608 [Saprospiraceae bacterium]|jgi:hypothetical protein